VAGDAAADAFLSLHFNGFDGKARGVEAWVRSKASGNVNHAQDSRFAERVLGKVYEAVLSFDKSTKNRGVKDASFGVLRDDLLGNSSAHHPCSACLLEIEFLDTAKVDELFNTGPRAAEVRQSVADAIARALLEEIDA
jgi:N-acetylmuramoyl-L-alanine amidase